MKIRKRIGDIGDPWGIPAGVGSHSLWCPGYAIRVRLAVRKPCVNWVIQSGKPLFCRTHRSRLWETLSNAPPRSRLSIDTTQPGLAFHAARTHVLRASMADIVERCFRAPIWFQ